MNKIIYFTTAQDQDSFVSYLKEWSVSPNLSNQNFHNKLIRALSISHEIEVISVRPINKNFSEKRLSKATKMEDNVLWKYVAVSSSRLDKLLNLKNRINDIAEGNYDGSDIVFVDTLNLSLLTCAYNFAKKHGLRVIGVCTDNPSNISFSNATYQKKVIALGQKLDGYIALTEKIEELYNINHKPSITIDGVTEKITPTSSIKIDSPFIYFGGSLMRRYGLYSLIEAFSELEDKNIKLVICGHHEESGFQDFIKGNDRIIYLGALPYNDVIYLLQHSLCAVNPRPNDILIDEYSIPSKTLEYLASGAITITVNNELLNRHYKDAIIWSKSSAKKDLLVALNKALSLTAEEKKTYLANASKAIDKYTSFKTIDDLVNDTLF